MVLPAPVSPVTTVNPEDSSSTASSITPRPVIRTSSSIGGWLLLCALGGSAAPAADRQPELDHQPVGERRAAGLRSGVLGQPRQQHRLAATPDLHPGARGDIDTAAPLAPHDAGRGPAGAWGPERP